ncbi:SDR family oxidoreductase [Candidatus Saccharibacteria bacterium]|nr:SDR family oxidoreductase [Candidatus Saccharibacteria bacterium]
MKKQFLKDKVALITGGSQGLGEAISRRLAHAGATVCIADIKKEQAEQVAASITEAGGKAVAIELNVTSPEGATRVVEQLKADQGSIDILVNNAGTDATKPLTDLTVDDWNRVIGVNLSGPFLLSKAVYPVMKAQGSGHVINITSTAAKRTWTEATAYHASKWGLLGFSHALHAEGRRDGIKVTAVVAGGMRTAFILERFPDTDPNVLQDPKNVAETVCFALSLPDESVIPEVMVLPMRETSWP